MSHVRDPEVIAPGLRQPPTGAIRARRRRSRSSPTCGGCEPASGLLPSRPRSGRRPWSWARYCATCHMIDGEGASSAPDLTHVGRHARREMAERVDHGTEAVDPFATMPAFGEVLSEAEMTAIVNYLAAQEMRPRGQGRRLRLGLRRPTSVRHGLQIAGLRFCVLYSSGSLGARTPYLAPCLPEGLGGLPRVSRKGVTAFLGSTGTRWRSLVEEQVAPRACRASGRPQRHNR